MYKHMCMSDFRYHPYVWACSAPSSSFSILFIEAGTLNETQNSPIMLVSTKQVSQLAPWIPCICLPRLELQVAFYREFLVPFLMQQRFRLLSRLPAWVCFLFPQTVHICWFLPLLLYLWFVSSLSSHCDFSQIWGNEEMIISQEFITRILVLCVFALELWADLGWLISLRPPCSMPGIFGNSYWKTRRWNEFL